MKMRQVVPSLLAIAVLSGVPPIAMAQTSAGSGGSTGTSTSTTASKPGHAQPGAKADYVKPDFGQRFHNYLFDSFGPYPLIGAGIAAGINQANSTPPEWSQGAEGFGYRYASNFGINLTATTVRYGLAEVFREDTIYYRCECSGFFPRFSHAIISTVTSRRGADGHRFISFPQIAAPYAGTETAALGWYPSRYNAMDGFRMGNYLLATYGGLNLLKEFVYGGPHTLVKNVPMLSHNH
ncbi:MAG: hypothetical protein ACRD5M_08140 [Candidatus Acidiferrales bacterium]